MDIKLRAEIRKGKSTKGELSEMRRGRRVPGVVYGGDGGNVTVAVAEKELLAALKAGGANAIIHLQHDKGEDTVIVKELKRHVVTSQPIHADFQRISLKKRIEVKVPLHVVGESPGVKLHGGILEHILRDLKVRCLPHNIPQRIEVDISALEVGKAIHVSELPVPEGVEVLEDAAHIVVNVVLAKEEAAAPAAAPGAEGAAAGEPEVIAKGKKEEEAGEAKAEGKGEAKAEKGKAAAPAAEKGKEGAKKEGGKKE